MTGVLSAFARAFGQLGDRRVIGVLLKSAALTVAIAVTIGAVLWGLTGAALDTWLVPHLPGDYSGTVRQIVAVSAALIGGWLLFRIVALAVLQFFADEVVRAVEARHFPEAAAAARDIPFAEEARNALAGGLRAVLVNLIALPVALLLLVTGIGTAVLFWAVNAWLLGRELQDMVWLRHRAPGSAGMGAAPPLSGLTRLALGGIVAAMMLVPLINLLAPVIGAAAATHLVHDRRRTP